MKVYIEELAYNREYARMFEEMGFEVVEELSEADLVQFVGGADVTPSLYGEPPHSATFSSMAIDDASNKLFQEATHLGIPMAGICRGGQFLNVMSGGEMWQHVDNHGIYGTHQATDQDTGKVYAVTSTHHQMMRPGKGGKLIGVARECSFRDYVEASGEEVRIKDVNLIKDDVEVLYYEGTNCLCFQPHPEMTQKGHECQEWYFELLDRYLGVKV